jgi:alkylhydroperoxidase family enzyme
MRVSAVEPADAPEPVARMYEADLASRGYIPNFTRLFSLNPEAYAGWLALISSIRTRMPTRRYELATLAAASALRGRYCVAAHALAVLDGHVLTRAELEAVLQGDHGPGPDGLEAAVVALASQVARDASLVTAAEVDRLRNCGMTDAEVFDVVLAASARAFFSKTVEAMAAEPDDALAPVLDLADLVDAPSAPRSGCG